MRVYRFRRWPSLILQKPGGSRVRAAERHLTEARILAGLWAPGHRGIRICIRRLFDRRHLGPVSPSKITR